MVGYLPLLRLNYALLQHNPPCCNSANHVNYRTRGRKTASGLDNLTHDHSEAPMLPELPLHVLSMAGLGGYAKACRLIVAGCQTHLVPVTPLDNGAG